MYKHLLIPTDGSELSKKAVQHGIALAKACKAKVTAITVSAPFLSYVAEPVLVLDSADRYREVVLTQTKHAFDVVRHAAEKAGVACELVHVEHDHPYQAIIDTVKAKKCDLIVMASHGRNGVSAVLLGSVTAKVLAHCTVPVLVYR